MSEKIGILENNNSQITPYDRDKFYEEQVKFFKETGKINKYVEVVNVYLFNCDGQIILQKRASSKSHNPNLIDKSIGGHITFGDQANYTAMLETVQELQVPSVFLNNEEDFLKTYELLKNYTNITAIVKYFGTEFIELNKIIKGEKIKVGNKTYLYIGIYDGSIKNVDNVAKGVLFYNLDELEKEINDFPDIFSEDLKYHFKKYKKELIDFSLFVQNKK